MKIKRIPGRASACAVGLCAALLLTAACAMGPQRSQSGFKRQFAHTHRVQDVEVWEIIGYRARNGEGRYRLIGGWHDDTMDVWRLQWADYGQAGGREQWIALEYPRTPVESVPTRRHAIEKAREMRREFEEEIRRDW